MDRRVSLDADARGAPIEGRRAACRLAVRFAMPISTAPVESLLDPPGVPTSRDAIPVTPATRAHFAAAASGLFLWAIPMAVAQATSHRRLVSTGASVAALGRNLRAWGRRWARILRTLGFDIRLDDRSGLAPDAGPVVFVGTHQTALDVVAVFAVVPQAFVFTPKIQLRSVPIVGLALRNSPSVFIDKRDARRAVRSLQDAAAQVAAGTSVMIYPEGRRSYSGGLLPFERGAFVLAVEAGVPIVPFTLRGVYRLMDERRAVSRSGSATVRLFPPIDTQGLTRTDVPALMACVRATFAADLADYEATHPV